MVDAHCSLIDLGEIENGPQETFYQTKQKMIKIKTGLVYELANLGRPTLIKVGLPVQQSHHWTVVAAGLALRWLKQMVLSLCV